MKYLFYTILILLSAFIVSRYYDPTPQIIDWMKSGILEDIGKKQKEILTLKSEIKVLNQEIVKVQAKVEENWFKNMILAIDFGIAFIFSLSVGFFFSLFRTKKQEYAD